MLSTIYKELLKVNNKKISNSNKQAKNLNRNLTKEDIQIAKKHMKRCFYAYVIRENANYNHNEIPLYMHQQGQNLEPWQQMVRMSNRNSHTLLVGVRSGITILKTVWWLLKKLKHIFTISSSNRSPWSLPKGVENMSTQKPKHWCLQKLCS